MNQSNNNQITVNNNKPQIKIYPSKLNIKNQNAIDINWQNLLAYGCHSHVVILDPIHLQVLQTLDEHRYFVSVIKWSNDISPSASSFLLNQQNKETNIPTTTTSNAVPSSPNSNTLNNSNNLVRLASADINGHIIIWNVLDAAVLLYLPANTTDQNSGNSSSNSTKGSGSVGSSTICDLCWHPDDPDLLLSLHSGYLSLWNVSNGGKLIWKRDIPDGFVGFSIQFDPFKSTRVFISTSFGVIYQIDDLSSHQLPLIDFKYRIYTNKNSNGLPILNTDIYQLSNQWSSLNNSSKDSNNNNSSSNNTNSNNNSSNSSSNNSNLNSLNNTDFLQMKFSPYCKNLIYYVLHREIYMYDSNTNQLFGSLVLDRNKSSFVKILLCKDNSNLMFTLHDDGSITSWNKRLIDDNFGNGIIYSYDQICISDLSHYQKKSKKKGSGHHHGHSSSLSSSSSSQPNLQMIFSFINSPFFEQTCFSISGDGCCLKWDFISEISIYGSSNLYQPRLQQLSTTPLNGVIKLAVSGYNETISSPNTSLSVYPFYNRSNTSLIAIGTGHGTIQIVNMSTFKIQKEIFVWQRPIYGIRWLSPGRVLCFSYEEQDKGNYLNYITSVDFRSGRIKEFRKVSGSEPTPIKGIRLSYSRKFLVILLKDRPFELWETKRFTLLRSFKPFVHIVGLEWLPPKEDSEVELSSDFSKYEAREQFTFLLQDSTVKQCTIEQNSVTLQDVQADLGPLQNSLASKREFLVSGDVGGTIHSWNCLKKKLHTFSTHRGPIKKIRFSPNPQSFEIFVLFLSGEFGIWDLNLNQRIAVGTYLLERDIKVIDFEWLTEQSPIVVGQDNSLRVLDLSLTVTNSKFHFSSAISQSIYSQHNHDNSITGGIANSNGGYLYSPILLPTIQWLQLKNLLLNYRVLLFSDPIVSNEHQSPQDLNRSYDNSYIIKDNTEKNSRLLSYIDDKLLSILTPTVLNEDSSSLSKSSSFIYKCNGISLAESNLTVSQYFGEYKEMEFWRIVISSLLKYKNRKFSNQEPFYDNDLIEYYDSLPCLPSIPLADGSNSNNIPSSSPMQTPLNSLNTSSVIPNNGNNNNNTTTNTSITPNLISLPNTINNSNVSPSIISTPSASSTPTTNTTSSVQSTASNLLKKPLVSFFGFGQKSTPPATQPSPPITSSTNASNTTNTTTTNSTPISNTSPNSLGVSSISPPTTPSKSNNLLSSSSSGLFPLLNQLSLHQQPAQPPTQSQLQPQIVQPPIILNPLSQSYSSVAAQLNQSTMELSASNSSVPNSINGSTASLHDLNKSTTCSNNNINSSNISNNINSNSLPNYYDILLESHNLRSLELERTDSYEKKKPDSDLTKKLIERNILLGRNPRAVNLLLDTTPDHPDFFNRAMKACVISASISQECYQNTTKLIADNLIAVGKLDEGVQFLCLIGKTMEACKYLQSCDRWYDAAMLSKTNLSESEHFVVFRAWVIHLLSTSGIGLNNRNLHQHQQQRPQNIKQSINLLLSIGDFKSVIQILYETQQYDLASLLIDSCLENNVFSIPNFDTDNQDSIENDMLSSVSVYSNTSNNDVSNSNSPLKNSTGVSFKFNQLVQVIFKEYGNLLHQLGFDQGAEYYWIKASKRIYK